MEVFFNAGPWVATKKPVALVQARRIHGRPAQQDGFNRLFCLESQSGGYMFAQAYEKDKYDVT